jgi:hypothetical protein
MGSGVSPLTLHNPKNKVLHLTPANVYTVLAGKIEDEGVAMSRRKRPDDVVLEPTYLREWRVFRKMSLEAVGKVMGLDKSALSKMERNVTPYDQVHLQQMRDIYRVTIPDLLFTDPKRPKASSPCGCRASLTSPRGA